MLRFAGWMAWWIALFLLWLLVAGEWNRVELLAAACAATLGASIAEGVRAFTGVKVQIPLRDIASAWTVPLMVFVDFGIVVGALLRSGFRRERVGGRFVVRDLNMGTDFGSRAWLTYAATVSPNAYVVDVDDEQRAVLLHDLVPYRKSEEPAA